jgi:hypothetical protein
MVYIDGHFEGSLSSSGRFNMKWILFVLVVMSPVAISLAEDVSKEKCSERSRKFAQASKKKAKIPEWAGFQTLAEYALQHDVIQGELDVISDSRGADLTGLFIILKQNANAEEFIRSFDRRDGFVVTPIARDSGATLYKIITLSERSTLADALQPIWSPNLASQSVLLYLSATPPNPINSGS